MSFSVYRSSAGSGKTFTLVKEYLKIALTDTNHPPKQFRRILAITFTNKAAAEMKDRIIKALQELSADDHTKIPKGARTLLEILIRETGFSPDVLRERAGSVLKAILHNYSDFAIGTIDSFVHRVVRSFAFDLKLPVNFEIELDAGKLLSEAVSILISRIGEDEELTLALVEFSETKADEEKSWQIEGDLHELAYKLMEEGSSKHLDKLREMGIADFMRINKNLREFQRSFEKRISTLGKEAMRMLDEKHLNHEVFVQKKKGIRNYFEGLAKGTDEKFLPGVYPQTTVEQDKWLNKEASSSDQAALDSIKGRLTGLYHSIQDILEKELPRYRLCKLVGRNIYSLAVLNEIEKILETYKQENSILHISEFNKLIAAIVFHEPVPFIYERLGERYTNYLIDEFQDTSILQWQNLLPLIDNALGEDQFTMLVGDGKQAIYRWRGGDVGQFADLPMVSNPEGNPLVAERESSLHRHYKPEFLGANFRSKVEIIQFNNQLYRKLSETLTPSNQRIYEKLEQKGDEKNTGGCVSIEFFDGTRDEKISHQLERIETLIRQCYQQGYAYSDIAILNRTNKEGNRQALYLMEKGIPVLSNDSLLLKNSASIAFLCAALKHLHNPEDSVARAEMIRFLSAGAEATVLQHNLLQAADRIAFRNWMQHSYPLFHVSSLLRLPLFQLCEELLLVFGLGEKADPFVIFFLDEILAFSKSRDNSLQAWIEHWEERKDKASAIVPDGMNAVNILTIHRSKGLEYPVVILPLSDTAPRAGKDTLWLDPLEELITGLPAGIVQNQKEVEQTDFASLYQEEQGRTQLDNLNLLYVATTRPEQRLYVLCGKWKEGAKPGSDFSSMMAWYIQTTGQQAQEDGRFLSGTDTESALVKKEEKQEGVLLNQLVTADWRDRIHIRSATREAWSEEQLHKQDMGLIIHTVLSRIHSHTDLDKALNTVVAEGIINQQEAPEIRNTLQAVLNHKTLKPFFEEGLRIKNEADILIKGGGVSRPDRIIYMKEKTVILDYKTGTASAKHIEQIEDYSTILGQMGATNIERYLVYTDTMEVKKV
ncbi:MAG: UvrD-helicase domain-containing protein [Bacteroidia bacterium]